MRNYLQKAGIFMAFIYVLMGLYFGIGPLLFEHLPLQVENTSLFGGLLLFYGLFRIYREYTYQPKK